MNLLFVCFFKRRELDEEKLFIFSFLFFRRLLQVMDPIKIIFIVCLWHHPENLERIALFQL
jgi:hypothetical protein